MSDFVYAVPSEYPTHPNTSPERAAVQLEDFLTSVAAEQVQRTVEQLDARLMASRAALALIEERIEAISKSVFLPLAEVQNLSTNMDLAQKELERARRAVTDAYQRKTVLEDERKVAEAVVAISDAAKGANDHERKYKLPVALAADGDYMTIANAARQAVFDHEEAQGIYDLAEKKHQACRAVLELYAGWLNSLS